MLVRDPDQGTTYEGIAVHSTPQTASMKPETCACRDFFFFSSRRRHTRLQGDWSSDVCSSDLEFALPTLDALLHQHEVVAVVTQPDRPAHRGRRLTPPPVKATALAAGLPVVQIGRASCRERV